MLHNAGNHLIDGIPHALSVQHLAALTIDDLTLLIHNLIVIQQVLTNAEVIGLDLLLCAFHRL